MKKRRINLLMLSSLIAFTSFITSCKDEKEEDPNPTPVEEPSPGTTYDNGVFITCEGPYASGSGTGTVSFYNRSTGVVSNDIYRAANSVVLGNIVQSMEIYGGKGYVVVNNANKIEVVNPTTFKNITTISGLTQPRYFLGVSSTKGYVSQWGDFSGAGVGIRVIDLFTNSAGVLIPTGSGSEKMLLNGSSVYVVNSGGFGIDSTVSVINTTTNAVVATLNVGYKPNSIALDKNGKIWVLCGGIKDSLPTPAKAGKLVQINPSTNTIEATFAFPTNTLEPINLCINKSKDKLLYLGNPYGGEMYSFPIGSSSVSLSAEINRNFYGLNIDGSDDVIYASDAGGFASNGSVFRYNSVFSQIDSFQVGIIPGNFIFK